MRGMDFSSAANLSDHPTPYQRIKEAAERPRQHDRLFDDDQGDARLTRIGDRFMLLGPRTDGEIADPVVAGRIGVAALQDDGEFLTDMAVHRQAAARLELEQRHAMFARQAEPHLLEAAERA